MERRHMRIKRDKYLDDLKLRMGNGMIKVITGIRRCGKTYLLFELFGAYLRSLGVDEAHLIEIALDDDQFEAYEIPGRSPTTSGRGSQMTTGNTTSFSTRFSMP